MVTRFSRHRKSFSSVQYRSNRTKSEQNDFLQPNLFISGRGGGEFNSFTFRLILSVFFILAYFCLIL